MKDLVIPKKEHDNVLHVLWVLLQEREMKLDKIDPFSEMQVSQAYNLLNRIGYTKERPRFEKNKEG